MGGEALMSFAYVPPLDGDFISQCHVVTDPVCGCKVETYEAAASAAVAGAIYYFCSSRCHARFTQRPSMYIGQRAKS